MRKLSVFNFVTLNGYFKGANEDISWHKQNAGDDENEYAAQGAQSNSTLLFGRVTYEMMAGFWPTEMASQSMPEVAKGMNASEKIVFSKTLKKDHPIVTGWTNTKVMKGDLVEEVKKMKAASGNPITILGSGNIVSQLADAGLIDEYLFMMDPIALGEGTSSFKGMKRKLELKLISAKPFKSGAVLLTYKPL